jgi:hypothetical protein
MKRIALLFLCVSSAAGLLQAQGRWSFKGTVTKMRMTDCTVQHGFISAMSGTQAQTVTTCPEYTVMNDKVVYVVVGRHTEEFIPLAENMEFLIRKNELVIFSDDEKTKSRFVIQQMMLRADWDREQARKELETKMMERSVNYEARNPSRTSMVSSNAR